MFYDELNPMIENANNFSWQITACFADKEEAREAVSELEQCGFSVHVELDEQRTTVSTDLGINRGVADPEAQHSTFAQKVTGFFSHPRQEKGYPESSASELGREQERLAQVFSGGAMVTVSGGNLQEARRILQRCGGKLREEEPARGRPAA